MHFVFLNQYYPPDAAPTGVMLQGVAEQLVEDGHEVTVFCASGGYAGSDSQTSNLEKDSRSQTPERRITGHGQPTTGTRPTIVRIGAPRFGRGTFVGKLIDYASFYLGVSWRLLTMRPAPERVVALTTPPYLSVLARAISKLRGADHAHWVMDLYPDVMSAHGMLREKDFLYKRLAGLTRWGFGGKRCAAVLSLGPDMAERISGYFPAKIEALPEEPIAKWVPLWDSTYERANHSEQEDTGKIEELRQKRGWQKDDLVVMYSGNLGLGHPISEVLVAAKTLKGSSVRFEFYGGGKRRVEVEAFVRENPDCPVAVHDYASATILKTHLQSADVHLVSLAPSWSGTMVPSKLQGIFAVGRPVIFIGSENSSIGKWISQSGGGWIVPPGEVGDLLAAISEAKNANERMIRGAGAARFSRDHFDKKKNITRTCEVLTATGGLGVKAEMLKI